MDGAAAKRTEGKELLGRSQSSPLISVPSPWATLKDGGIPLVPGAPMAADAVMACHSRRSGRVGVGARPAVSVPCPRRPRTPGPGARLATNATGQWVGKS